eukprot:9267121-Heterocapsa_arctica.AAC.1
MDDVDYRVRKAVGEGRRSTWVQEVNQGAVHVARSGDTTDNMMVCRSTARLRRPQVGDDVLPEVRLLRGPARVSSA